MKEKIGFVGLGLMGNAMAARLLESGYNLYIFNRTKQKADSLITKGAIWCDSAASAAKQAKIFFSMVSTPSVLEKISLGKDGILSSLESKSIHIDCSTVSPEITKMLENKYKEKGCYFIHSPVLGGVAQINTGTLLLFVGGNKEAYDRVKPVLNIFSSKIWHFEHIEQATITKLICNSIIAGMSAILAQSLVLAKKSKISQQTLLDIIGQSQLAAPMYQIKGGSMIERNFAPRFYIEHIFKDLNLVLDVAKSLNVQYPVGLIAQELYSKAMDTDLAKEDYSAVIKVIEMKKDLEDNPKR